MSLYPWKESTTISVGTAVTAQVSLNFPFPLFVPCWKTLYAVFVGSA